MEGKRVIIDERHAVRQHKVFAIFVVVGLLIIGLVWYLQVRMAIGNGALTGVQSGAESLSDSWQEKWEGLTPLPATPEATDTVVVDDAVQKAMQDFEIRQEIGRQATEAMTTQNEPEITEPQTQE